MEKDRRRTRIVRKERKIPLFIPPQKRRIYQVTHHIEITVWPWIREERWKKKKKRGRTKHLQTPQQERDAFERLIPHTDMDRHTHTHVHHGCLSGFTWENGGRAEVWEIKKKEKEWSRCRVFRRAKQWDTVDMNCCFYMPVKPSTKDKAVAVDVKEVQNEGENKNGEEDKVNVRREKRPGGSWSN